MLEKPAISDESIHALLSDAYRLDVVRVEFLPLGADEHTAVYQVETDDNTSYFVKLRFGAWKEISITLPKYLHDQGISQIIAPLPNQDGRLWTSLEEHALILFPYIHGKNGYQAPLTENQWKLYGKALRRIHAIKLPGNIERNIRREHHSPQWRATLTNFINNLDEVRGNDQLATELIGFMKSKRDLVIDLINRSTALAEQLQAHARQEVLCHADLHAGNFLTQSDGSLYIVDWDDPLMAPKERDLMFVGGALMAGWRSPEEEQLSFYKGYGATQIDPIALAYYRYERIIEDLAIFYRQISLAEGSRQDRAQSLVYLKSNFQPGGTIDIAYKTDQTR